MSCHIFEIDVICDIIAIVILSELWNKDSQMPSTNIRSSY